MKYTSACFRLLFAILGLGILLIPVRAEPKSVDQLISTGDNHYLADSIPVDSEASIDATFAMFKEVFNTKRIYWRGLQEAAWAETMEVREENFRYATFHEWSHFLVQDLKIEKLATDIAHRKGMELWGVASIGDWGSSADTPGFNDFPFNCEARLRLENPDWVPVDKYGYRKQGGTIELAYPEARKALVDLHLKLCREAGYDGIAFLTYVENFSLRFQDEFGYSEPIVKEFKKRYGIDIREQEFTRYASRFDWQKLRGEYVTLFLQEMKAALMAEGIKMGMFLNPQDIRKPLIWATLPFDYQTMGNIHMDVDTWVKEGIVDRLLVWGGCAPQRQVKTVEDVLWLTKGSDIAVAALTSNPYKALAGVDPAVERVGTLHSEASYLMRSPIPEQTEQALVDGTIYEKMRFLAQVKEHKSQASVEKILPFIKSPNILIHRLALGALGATKDPAAVPEIEKALFDPEVGIRGAAMNALKVNHRPESIDAIFKAIEKDGTHPLGEMARNTVPRLSPAPAQAVIEALGTSSNTSVRNLAARSLGLMPVPVDSRVEAIEALSKALSDPDPYVRYSAAMSLAAYRSSPEAVEALMAALPSSDAPTANRAAVSLGEMVGAGYKGDQRPQILQGLKNLFQQFGDGSQRSDLEWGHRSVGNALLAFGDDGTEALQGWMVDGKDQRLAEMSWQVLYFREKAGGNKFNVISEKENEEAYRKRPPHMERLLIEKISQDFEGELPETGSFGDVHKMSGRWSMLGPKGQFVEKETVHSGSQALRLSRRGGPFVGRVVEGVSEGYGYEAVIWIHRSQGAALDFSVEDQSRTTSVAIRVDPAGRVLFQTTEGDRGWEASDLVVGDGVWTKLAVRADPLSNIYQFVVNSSEESGWDDAVTAPLNASGPVDRVMITATAEDPEQVIIDDVSLIERH